MPSKRLKKIGAGKTKVFKIRNRRGYAVVCANHLTEGRTPAQAFERMVKAVKRAGWELIGKVPRARG